MVGRSYRVGDRMVLALVAGLVLSAGVVLATEAQRGAKRERRAREFQTLLRGLGMGASVDLNGCAFAFDPRLERQCSRDLGPLPSGSAFCARHALSVFGYSPLQRRSDAHIP